MVQQRGASLERSPPTWLPAFCASPLGPQVHKDSYGRFAADSKAGDNTSLGWNDFMRMSDFLAPGGAQRGAAWVCRWVGRLGAGCCACFAGAGGCGFSQAGVR